MVSLISQPNSVYNGGVTSIFATVDDAKAQAVLDLQVGREPAPDRITEDGSILFDHNELVALAFPDND